MRRTPAPESGNFRLENNDVLMGIKSPQELKIQPVPRLPPLPVQPIQPVRAMPPGGGCIFGNQRTMNIPGAPKLPNNSFADRAWWRQMYGPK
jgi:hypothetical protein